MREEGLTYIHTMPYLAPMVATHYSVGSDHAQQDAINCVT